MPLISTLYAPGYQPRESTHSRRRSTDKPIHFVKAGNVRWFFRSENAKRAPCVIVKSSGSPAVMAHSENPRTQDRISALAAAAAAKK